MVVTKLYFNLDLFDRLLVRKYSCYIFGFHTRGSEKWWCICYCVYEIFFFFFVSEVLAL